jgi:hypothetical protein
LKGVQGGRAHSRGLRGDAQETETLAGFVPRANLRLTESSMCCVCVGPVSLGEKPFNRPSNRSLRCRSLLQSVETLDDGMAARQLFPVQCEPPHALSKPVSVHQAEEQPARGWSYAWWHPATRNHPVVRSDANHGVSPLQQPSRDEMCPRQPQQARPAIRRGRMWPSSTSGAP